jgi:hypothetical protein
MWVSEHFALLTFALDKSERSALYPCILLICGRFPAMHRTWGFWVAKISGSLVWEIFIFHAQYNTQFFDVQPLFRHFFNAVYYTIKLISN